MGFAVWFTNLPHDKRAEELILWAKYDSETYPRYDNYPAIEVSRTRKIPEDYMGEMGVPISYLTEHNPEQFEIVGLCWLLLKNHPDSMFKVNGRRKYRRIVIRRKR